MNPPLILAYLDAVRAELHRLLSETPDLIHREFETTSPFRSIHALLAHLIGAEERWVWKRILGRELGANYETRAADTLDGLFADWEAARTETRHLVATLDDAGWQRRFHLSLAGGLERDLTVEEAMYQLFNHQTFHVAQISMLLQQFGIDPPNLDYPMLAPPNP